MPASGHPSRASESLALERRRSARRAHVAAGVLSSPTGGGRVEVLSVDVSRHGICLTLGRPIAAGTFHRLEFATDAGRPAREVRILSCHPQDDGSFHAHAEFC
jgi:PilZ domain-containing protein